MYNNLILESKVCKDPLYKMYTSKFEANCFINRKEILESAVLMRC